jgi:hypothetical protein
MDPYISFTISYLTNDFTLHSVALENKHFQGQHTADAILEALEKCMVDWKLPTEIPIFCVRDNGANLRAAVRRSSWNDVPCFAHTLQLSIADAISASDGMTNMLQKARRIVTHYHHSCVAMERIHSYQKARDQSELDFVMSCPTRWNSEYAMIDRLLQLKESVSADITAMGILDNLTNSEWKLATGFSTVLKPFADATATSSGETYPTRSMVIPLRFNLKDVLTTFVSDITNRSSGIMFARQLLRALDERFPQYLMAEPDCICTFLDARFKNILFDEATVKFIITQLLKYAAEMIPRCMANQPNLSESEASTSGAATNDIQRWQSAGLSGAAASIGLGHVQITNNEMNKINESVLWSRFDTLSRQAAISAAVLEDISESIKTEVKAYLKEPVIKRQECTLQWWANNNRKFPFVSILARAFLCIPATQTKSERLNSTSSNIATKRRAALTTEHLTELTFLHENL